LQLSPAFRRGLLLSAAVHCADIQDRDGAASFPGARARALFPLLQRIFTDAGYQGPRGALTAASCRTWVVEIVKRNQLHPFVVLPQRWIVERTIAWLKRCRRLAKDPGKPQSQSPRVPAPRINPPHAPKALQPNMNCPDRL
jgi:transposase